MHVGVGSFKEAVSYRRNRSSLGSGNWSGHEFSASLKGGIDRDLDRCKCAGFDSSVVESSG